MYVCKNKGLHSQWSQPYSQMIIHQESEQNIYVKKLEWGRRELCALK